MDIIPLDQRFVGKDLANIFNKVCIEEWGYEDNQDFDLVALADELTRDCDGDPSLKMAIQSVSSIGKCSVSNKNAFHNAMHTAHVMMMAAYFAKQAGVEDDDYLMLVLAAVGHDQFHPGTTNPVDDIFKNERHSMNGVKELLEERIFPSNIILDLEAIIHSTSPNGPHDFVKGAVDNPVVESQKRLMNNPRLMQMAQILCDADIFVSAGVDVRAVIMASNKLNAEYAKAGIDIDFNNPEVRMYFLDHIVGKSGFCSQIVRELANDNFFEIRNQTQLSLNPK